MTGLWWAAAPKEKWPESAQWHTHIKSYFEGKHGDRRQELVLIGIDMDQEKLTAMLDACLLTDAEMKLGKGAWKKFNDPFPAWGKKAA